MWGGLFPSKYYRGFKKREKSREVRQNWLNFAYPENDKKSAIKSQLRHLYMRARGAYDDF